MGEVGGGGRGRCVTTPSHVLLLHVEHVSYFILFQYRNWNVPEIWYITPAGPLGNPLLIHGRLYSVEFYKSDEENPDGPLIKE